MLRKQLERLEAQAAQTAAQPDGGDPPPGGGGGGGDGGGAGGKAAKDRERVRPDPPTPPDSDADSSEDDVGGGGHRGPPRLGGGVGRDDAVGELFGGHVLACDYDSDNPFERKRGLQQRTSHYSPAAAGDTVHAELHRKLGAANQREVCTLLPSLSYMYDLCAHLERLEDAIGDERDDPGDSRRALRLVHEQVRAARLQAGSILAFGQERLDELESVGKGPLEAAEFDPLYGNERSQSGARSLLGQRLHESRVSRRHTRLGSAVASADIARLKPKPPDASKRLGRLGGGGGGDGGGGGRDGSGSSRRGGGDSGGNGGGQQVLDHASILCDDGAPQLRFGGLLFLPSRRPHEDIDRFFSSLSRYLKRVVHRVTTGSSKFDEAILGKPWATERTD